MANTSSAAKHDAEDKNKKRKLNINNMDKLLRRRLMFTDRDSIKDYTRNSDQSFAEFNMALFRKYIEIKDLEYRWKPSDGVTFNEVYFQVTRICNDNTGETDVYNKYLNDSRDTLGRRYESDLIFSMVCAVMSVKSDQTEDEFSILHEIKKKISNTLYFEPMMEFAEAYRKSHGCLVRDFSYNPVPLAYLAEFNPANWENATGDFDQKTIKNLVSRYSAKEDKLALIDLIEKQQQEFDKDPYRFELPF